MRIELTPLISGKAQAVSVDTSLETNLSSLFEHLNPLEINPISVKGQIQRADKKLFFEFTYSGEFQIACDRCLKPFTHTFEGEVSGHLEQGEEPLDDSEEDVDVWYYQGDGLELDPVIWDDVLVNLPIQMVCQPDCQGLCPVCGQNQNESPCACDQEKVDPRLASLKDLLKHT